MRMLDAAQLSKKIDIPLLRTLSQVADSLQLPTYIIGGYVRDLFLERPSKDIDVVVVGSGIELAKAFAKALGRGASLAVYKTYGTAQVKWREVEVEFVGARKESYSRDSRNPIVEDGTLQEDQDRRDFTINALALSLNSETWATLLDPFNGIRDLKQGVIVTPLDPDTTFSDDPLRMMRAIRFATQLNFHIDSETFDSIRRNANRISIITRERIIDELNKIILAKEPSRGFVLLQRSGLLEILMPQLIALQGVETIDGKGHKDNFLHTLLVLDNVADRSDNLWLRWAALLHDIAKPVTKKWDSKIGWTFYNHNFIGEKMIPKLFKEWRLPLNDKMKYVQKMVSLHMRPIVLSQEEVTDSAVRRLLFDAGDDIDDLMLLCEADITSKNENKVRRFLSNFALVRKKLIEIEEKDRVRNMQPPISGEEIMQLYGLPPCREVGVLKSAIKEAILEGEIGNNYDEAMAYLLNKAAEMGITKK